MMYNPLGDKDLECCNGVLERTPPYIELAEACESCGWDWAKDMKARLQFQQQQATKIKQVFFPLQH